MERSRAEQSRGEQSRGQTTEDRCLDVSGEIECHGRFFIDDRNAAKSG